MSVQITKLSVSYELTKNVFYKGADGEKPQFVKVTAIVTQDGKVTILPGNGGKDFVFKKSDPLQALAVAELIAEAAGIAAREVGEDNGRQN